MNSATGDPSEGQPIDALPDLRTAAAFYRANGVVRGTVGGVPIGDIPVDDAEAEVFWDRVNGVLRLYMYEYDGDGQLRRVAAIKLTPTDPTGRLIKRIDLTVPMERGNVSFPFVLTEGLPFFGLDAGGHATGPAHDGTYDVRVSREERAVFRIEIAAVSGSDEYGFKSADVRLGLSSLKPPWEVIEIAFNWEDERSRFTAELSLRQTPE